jgi:hypothetical protein
MEIYCTGLLSPKSNVPFQQPKRRLPTNLSRAHPTSASHFVTIGFTKVISSVYFSKSHEKESFFSNIADEYLSNCE